MIVELGDLVRVKFFEELNNQCEIDEIGVGLILDAKPYHPKNIKRK